MFEVDSTKRRTFGLFVSREGGSTEAKRGNLGRNARTNGKSGEANNKISMSMHIAGLRLTKFANLEQLINLNYYRRPYICPHRSFGS